MAFKEKCKIVGWDDGPFELEKDEQTPLIGVVMSGGRRVEGVLRSDVEVDGLDVTEKLINSVSESKHYQELNLIALAGVTFAGFNVADISKVARETDLPVLAVTRNEPDLQGFKSGLRNLPDFRRRWEAARAAGEVHSHELQNHRVYFQTASLSLEDAKHVLEVTSSASILPEPLRLADMIARAIVSGES